MAKIALAIGGALAGLAIGAATGNPFLGFEIGYAIGSIGGSLLFPGHTSQTGPRLSDTLVSSSANGAPIIFLYGGARLPGQIIYSSGIKETKTTATQSAKGSPSQTTVSYTYTVDFDAAFCESDGTAGLSRIWADSKLIFDRTSKGAISSDVLATGIGTNTTAVVPAIYSGGATQAPDPTEQAALGIGATSAFRGLLRAVYENFPLADFGNRLPNIRAECSSGIVLSYLKDSYPNAGIIDPYPGTGPAYMNPEWIYVDTINRAAIILDSLGLVAERIDLAVDNTAPLPAWAAANVQAPGDQILDQNGHVQVVIAVTSDQKTGSTIPVFTATEGDFVADHHVTWQNLGEGPEGIAVTSKSLIDFALEAGDTLISTAIFPTCAGVDTSGFLWMILAIQAADTSRTWYAMKFDPRTFRVLARIPLLTNITSFNFVRTPSGGNQVVFTTNDNVGGESKVYFVDGQSASIKCSGSWVNTVDGSLSGGLRFPTLDDKGIAYIATQNLGAHTWGITVADGRSGVVQTRCFKYISNATVGVVGSMLWNPSDNSLIGLTENGYVIKVDVATMAVTATTAGPVFASVGAYSTMFGKSHPFGQVPADGLIRFSADEGAHPHSIAILDAITLAVRSTINERLFLTNGSNWPGILDQVYDVATNSLIVSSIQSGGYEANSYRLFLERQAVAGEGLDAVVANILTRAGLDSSLFDVTALAGQTVFGYPVTRNTDARTILQVLTQAYFFDLVESDFKIKAVPRGGSSVMTIPEDDLGIVSELFAIQETIAQEQDLPKSIDVIYSDPALDYQTGTQRRFRPSRVVKTINKVILELPLTLQADAAAQIADKALHVLWDERNTQASTLVSTKYVLLDPSDVFVFVYKGASYAARMSKTTLGQDLTVKVELCSEDARNYVSGSKGTSGDGFVGQLLDPTAPTLLFLFDIPLLLDTDAPPSGSTGFYFAMASPSKGWPGGALYSSADNEAYNQIGFENGQIEYGIISQVTPAPLHSPFSWDRDTRIIVRMISGTLSSTTELNVLNGANAFLWGGEVGQFQIATLIAPSTYELSNLLRGRRGTEGACATHTTGETFILLSATGIGRNSTSTGIIGGLRYYKGVTIGTSKDSATPQVLTLTGADLKPYAPASFHAATFSSHDIVLTWIRRTRVGGAWLDGIGTVPLSEAVESYDLELYDGATLVRTVTGLTSPTYTYAVQQQNTDFGINQHTIKAIVYQNSAAVGRGFPAENDNAGTSSGGGQVGVYQFTVAEVGGGGGRIVGGVVVDNPTIVNPNNIIDGLSTTFCEMETPPSIGTGVSSNVMGATKYVGGGTLASIQARAMPVGPGSPTTVVLTITYEVVQNDTNAENLEALGVTPAWVVGYSLDEGNTERVIGSGLPGAGAVAEVTVNTPLPPDITDLRRLLVRIVMTNETDQAWGTSPSGSVKLKVKEAFVTVT